MMKRYIKNIEPKYIIEVIINTDTVHSDVAAATSYVKHPVSIKKSARMSNQELQFYNDFIDEMHTPILSRNFIIINEYQSKKSYAYYIDFYPVDRDGKKFDEAVRILFRVAEHNQVHGTPDRVSEELIIKSFTLDGVTYPSPYRLRLKISDICEHLQDGDFDYVSNLRT